MRKYKFSLRTFVSLPSVVGTNQRCIFSPKPQKSDRLIPNVEPTLNRSPPYDGIGILRSQGFCFEFLGNSNFSSKRKTIEKKRIASCATKSFLHCTVAILWLGRSGNLGRAETLCSEKLPVMICHLVRSYTYDINRRNRCQTSIQAEALIYKLYRTHIVDLLPKILDSETHQIFRKFLATEKCDKNSTEHVANWKGLRLASISRYSASLWLFPQCSKYTLYKVPTYR